MRNIWNRGQEKVLRFLPTSDYLCIDIDVIHVAISPRPSSHILQVWVVGRPGTRPQAFLQVWVVGRPGDEATGLPPSLGGGKARGRGHRTSTIKDWRLQMPRKETDVQCTD